MKTSSVYNPENWVNFPKNKKHLEDLQKLVANRVADQHGNNEITKRADEVLLYIFTKVEPNQSIMAKWQSEVAKVAPGVKVVVQTMEKAMEL